MTRRVPAGHKRCPVCETALSHHHFHADKTQPDGLKRECKSCRSEAHQRSLLVQRWRDRAGYWRRTTERLRHRVAELKQELSDRA